MIEAGTTMPPIPRPATTRIPQSWPRLFTRAIESAPQPAVMRIEETIINALLWPRNIDKSQRTIQAPARMEKPIGMPRMPTPLSIVSTGYKHLEAVILRVLHRVVTIHVTNGQLALFYTLHNHISYKACVGQNIRILKKLAP